MKFRLGITAKLTLLFVFFAAVLLVGVSLLAYTSGRSALETATVFELISTALEKEAALNTWLEDRRLNIAVLASSPDLQAHVSVFMTAPDQAAHDRLVRSLQTWAGPEQQYLNLVVIEAQTGRVVAATDPTEEGKFREDRPYFIHGKDGPYIQNLYYSLSLQQPAMVASAPLYATDGRLLGVLAGWLNLEEMTTIIGRRTGLHQTDEAFLVNTAHLFVTQPRFITDSAVLRRGNHAQAVNACLNHNSGVISGADYRGAPAITTYRWLEDRQLCLIVKLDQAEALAPVHAFGGTILLIGGLALLGALVLATGLARTVTWPVLALQKEVARLGQGDLSVRLPVTTTDELGQLAQEFNLMAGTLSEKEAQLRHHAEKLEDLVRERTAALRTRVRQQAVIAELGQLALLETNIYTLMDKAVTLVAQTLEVEYCKLLELLPEGDNLLLRAGVGWRPGVVGQATVGIGPESQAGYTLLSGEPVILADLRTETRFNGSFLLHEHGVISGLSVVILGEDRPFGVLGVHTAHCRTFTPDDANFLQAIANVVAGAIERKEVEDLITQALQREQAARSEVEQIRERLDFLAEASKILASSMDYQTTLATVARLAVPHIADWCAVDVLAEAGGLNRVAVAHVDPSKVAYAYELQRRFPFDPDASTGVANVLRTGQSEFYPEINEAVLEATGADEEVLNIIRQLGLRSAITVPLRTYERVLGVITLVWAESGQHYTLADLDLAEELARRAGVAVENARLYREAQQLNIELEKRVKERTASLEAANKELEAFSYTVSHDLRSPLRAIDGFSRVVLEQYSPQLNADAQRYLHMVRHGAQQMGQLIDDLLTFSRLSRLPIRRQAVAPLDLVRQVLEELRVEQEGRQIELTFNDLPLCQADPALLKQVWFNLLANALKYTRQRETATIEVGYCQNGAQSAYFVKDNGVGFDMQYADKLFGVFQRLHLAEEYEGTGVGLAIVQRILHRHGGRIWAEAALDQGATFYFTLPK